MSVTHAGVASRLTRLDWECNHLGLFAAQLADPDLDDAALAPALWLAREQGIRLLVWPAEGERDVPSELLDEFGGALVDRKATFSTALEPVLADKESSRAEPTTVVPYTEKFASAALQELAISAGAYSRFRVDPHFPNETFQAMYCQWIERSVTKELADVVLVAPIIQDGAANHAPGGLITLSESGGVANIGLIAVAAAVRGRGLGSKLMRAAHGWMRKRGAREARVVTQLTNVPACRLYERSGYRLARTQHYYHFWL